MGGESTEGKARSDTEKHSRAEVEEADGEVSGGDEGDWSTELGAQTRSGARSRTHRWVLAAMDWTTELLSMRRSRALEAQPTTAGGRLLEKRYGRARCRSRATRGAGPVV